MAPFFRLITMTVLPESLLLLQSANIPEPDRAHLAARCHSDPALSYVSPGTFLDIINSEYCKHIQTDRLHAAVDKSIVTFQSIPRRPASSVYFLADSRLADDGEDNAGIPGVRLRVVLYKPSGAPRAHKGGRPKKPAAGPNKHRAATAPSLHCCADAISASSRCPIAHPDPVSGKRPQPSAADRAVALLEARPSPVSYLAPCSRRRRGALRSSRDGAPPRA